jgi:hypothetical protein
MPDPNSGFQVPPEVAQQIQEVNAAGAAEHGPALDEIRRLARPLATEAEFHEALRQQRPGLIRNHAIVERPACLAGPNLQTCPRCDVPVIAHGVLDGVRVCMTRSLFETMAAL